MKLSIVTTLYNSAAYIEEFYLRITQAACVITHDYEIIFVDDGSSDHSLILAKKLLLNDERIRVIELSRNFGHHKAMATGLKFSVGEYVFLIDSDLEEEPELLTSFWNEIHQNHDVDVVYGIQEQRKGNWFERWTGNLYYKILNILCDDVKSAKNISTVRIMRKNYVSALSEYRDHGYYFGPISILVGFKQKGHIFKKKCKDRTSYHFFKKYHIFLDSIFSFSSKPLYFIFYSGILITLSSFLYMLYLIMKKMIWGIAIHGWTSLIVLTSFLGGLNMLFMGIISVYILHIFQETKNRPFCTIKRIYHRLSNINAENHRESNLIEFENIEQVKLIMREN